MIECYVMNTQRKIPSYNHAYIDGANLHKGTMTSGWKIDYMKFYTWLQAKYHIKRAYIFIGYIKKYDQLYSKMTEAGFLVRFKETVQDRNGQIKGNCDADLVLRSASDVYESVFEKSVIVSSDGDFSCLVNFLQEKKKMSAVLSPSRSCSILLMRTGTPIMYLDDVKAFVCK